MGQGVSLRGPTKAGRSNLVVELLVEIASSSVPQVRDGPPRNDNQCQTWHRQARLTRVEGISCNHCTRKGGDAGLRNVRLTF